MTQYLRIHTERIEDDLLYGHTDAAEEVAIALHTADGADHRYLSLLIEQGSQVNIVGYRVIDNVYHPRLIILEPDYLVDVSAIAACCESYGNTHLTHLTNRLKPSVHTEAILLGHFASQLLDEEVHGMYGRPYRDSVMDFFRRYTFPLLAAGVSDSFHDNARRQRDNIHRVFTDTLTSADTEAILEPSFISEMLGLQGRIDYLQADHSLLIEQKAGRCGWPQQHPDIPVEQGKHAMQMMLYGAVVEQLQQGQPPRTCLLYSKYPQALLPLSPSEEMLREAIALRNHIVHAEYRYANEGYAQLLSLTADDLNVRGTASTLWTRYQRPQIAQTLAPIAEADAMERAYYCRMMQFISREHLYGKVGNGTGEHGYAAKWHDTLEEKLAKGDICHRLRLASPKQGHEGRVEQLTLTIDEDTDLQTTNFRSGDIVVLYPYAEGSEPDARQRIVYRCVLSAMTLRTLTLTLRAPQTDARVLLRDADSQWAIEHDFMEASYGSCYRALHAFLSMPRERRDLLLLRREPRVDTALTLQGEYGEFNSLVLHAKQARDMFLLVGPPGTGKTTFGLMSILHEELASAPDSAILLLAYTNRAVDEICDRLVASQLDFIRVGSPHTCPEEYRPYLLDTATATSTTLTEVRRHIEQSRIVVGTAMTLGAHSELFTLKPFSLAIIDEASQLLEPHLLGILGAMHKGRSAVERFVFIGDHKQLPAVVKQPTEESRVTDPLLHKALLTDCRESLFERMIKRYGTDEHITHMLHRQGRMHRDIAEFPNAAFYRGLLTEATPEQCAPLETLRERRAYRPDGNFRNFVSEVRLLSQRNCKQACISLAGTNFQLSSFNFQLENLFVHRVAFIDIADPEATPTDKVNLAEAALIAALAANTYYIYKETFDPHRTLGIIVPYRNQIAAVRRAIGAYGIDALADITIDTVERYQGSQRDVIIYGFTVHHATQLDFLTEQTFTEDDATIDRKLNVMMTRARRHLFMAGNAALLRTNPLFARLLDFVSEKGALIGKS